MARNDHRHIAVTGGAGFIGSHLIRTLLDRGYAVTCIDNFDTSYDPEEKRRAVADALDAAEDAGKFSMIRADIRNESHIADCLSERPVDLVVHLAARNSVEESIREPRLYQNINVTGTLSLLEAMRKTGITRLVYGSCGSVYGETEGEPVSERSPSDSPLSPYAASKKAAELHCHTFHQLYGFDIHCLRLFSVYGDADHPDSMISQCARSIRKGVPVVVCGNGGVKRDFVHVDDVVEAVISSIGRVKGFETINIGESRMISDLEVLRHLERELGHRAQIQWVSHSPGEPRQACADIRKAHTLLQYEPQISIVEGIRRHCAWLKSGKKSKEGALRRVG